MTAARPRLAAAVAALPAPERLEQRTKTDIGTITIGSNRRALNAERVREIASSMAELGQLQAIGVTVDKRLVYGYHRIEAAKLLDWSEIEAVVVPHEDALLLELAEIDENLMRADLTILERAECLARRKAIYEAKYPEARTRAGRPPKNAETVSAFSTDTAAKTGLSERTIQHDVQIAERLPEDVRDAIRATDLADSKRELLELARRPAEVQRHVAERIVAGAASTVREAERQMREDKRATDLARPAEVRLPGGIHHGDFRELAAGIADDSVDLIFTDPPYDEESVTLYGDAARIAARILKPGGSMVAYSGQRHLPQVYAELSRHLRYWWTIAGVHGGGNQMLQKLGIRCGWKPLVWYVKGTRGDVQNVLLDVVRGDREKDAHEWQQSLAEACAIIEKLCPEAGIVVDFFLGGGTTALACRSLRRRFIGFEVDASALERAAARLENAA